jgi:uncharacterized protein (DUF58 family)
MNEIGLSGYGDEISSGILLMIGIIFVILLLILLAAIFVKLSKIMCVRNLEYHRYFSDEGVFEGEETELIEEFTNHSFVPMFVVDVETHISSKIKMQGCKADDNITQCFISRFLIMPYTKIRRVHKAVCVKRGYYQLESAKITFAGIEVYLDSVAGMYVYPKELQLEGQRNVNHYLQYSARSMLPYMEDSFSFAGIRKYTAGDTLHAINYKQTARRGQWMVNSREYILGRKILIYLNFQPNEKKHLSLEESGTFIELELSYAACLLMECVQNGYVYALHANCKMTDGANFVRNDFTAGQNDSIQILKQMAQMRTQYGTSMASMIGKDIQDMVRDTEVFLFTMYTDDALLQRVEQLEQLGNVVNLINVLEE